MNDLTRWVAESDPLVDVCFGFMGCFYCKEDAEWDQKIGWYNKNGDWHAPGCRYMLAREQMRLWNDLVEIERAERREAKDE